MDAKILPLISDNLNVYNSEGCDFTLLRELADPIGLDYLDEF